jgi:hypothetical protein
LSLCVTYGAPPGLGGTANYSPGHRMCLALAHAVLEPARSVSAVKTPCRQVAWNTFCAAIICVSQVAAGIAANRNQSM